MVEEASRKLDLVRGADAAAVQPAAVKPRREKRLRAAEPERLPDAERSKVVHIVQRLQAEASQYQVAKQKPWVLLSMLLCIALPTIVAGIYYVFIAADQYVSEARFAVRSSKTQAADMFGMMTGLPSSEVVSDSYIVTEYIRSRDMIEQLEQRLSLSVLYSDPDADFIARLGEDPTAEEMVDYWSRRVDVAFDSTKNTVSVKVRAFNPDDAERIASEIVSISRDLVNELSAQARKDAVKFAASEMARAELRVRGARDAMLDFRVAEKDFDPSLTAAATREIVGGLEKSRSELNAQLSTVSGYLSGDAPSVQMLKSRIAALDEEIARVESQISSSDAAGAADGAAAAAPSDDALAHQVARYQALLLDQEFAEKAYATAQASLMTAQSDANREQSYLAVYMHPSIAEEAAYPRALLGILVVLIVSTVLWGVGGLAFLTVRDHMA